jgi:hypothetical protein
VVPFLRSGGTCEPVAGGDGMVAYILCSPIGEQVHRRAASKATRAGEKQNADDEATVLIDESSKLFGVTDANGKGT